MKPNDGTYAENALKWGVSGLNIDGGRVPTTDVLSIGAGKVGYESNMDGSNKGEQNPQGRFPANIILDEDYIPILCLTNTGDIGIIQAIKEFYYDYKLPNMPKRVQGISESSQEWSPEVLQQSLLLQSTIKTNDRKRTSVVRQKTQARVYTEDEAKTDKAGKGESSLQGGVYGEGLSLHQPPRTKSGRTGNGETDDNEGFNTRTPNCNGDEAGQAVKVIRTSTSPERNQKRQQAGESGSPDELNSQDEPQADIAGTSATTKRERGIEVLDCDIPSQWLKYFEPTGYEIRDPNCAGAMLDRQSGVSKSHDPGKSVGTKHNGIVGGNTFKGRGILNFHNDTGGASRFFYCAKASKAERNAGCEGLEEKQYSHDGRDKPIENAYQRNGSKATNSHPTVKPLALMEYLCKLTMTPTGGTVLDPFMGSGTTGKAAQNTGRRYIGIDISEEYCEIARQRLRAVDTGVSVKEQNIGQMAMFEGKEWH